MTARFEHVARFRALFSGLDEAFGTGKGQWIKRPVRNDDFLDHLDGRGAGIGIGPLRPDNTVTFAAIDLDEPNFELAADMQKYIPGQSWVERSRSGNAHVFVFFHEPVEAWVVMGILKMATEAVGRRDVEVFPKNHDFAMVKFGNYINLPYFGDTRPMHENWNGRCNPDYPLSLESWLSQAEDTLNDPDEWRRKARWLLIDEPRPRNEGDFGNAPNLHICAENIIANGLGVADGNRNGVFFMLAKCLSNWAGADHDYALEMMRMVNEDSPDPLPDSEIVRILGNAERGRYTSTGCSDAVVLPYAHPSCRIAFPHGRD